MAAATEAVNDRAERAFHHWGVAIGRALPSPGAVVPAADVELSPDLEPIDDSDLDVIGLAEAPSGKKSKHTKKSRAVSEPSELSIHIDEKRLVALSQSRSIPAGRPVPAKGRRPPGIALFGVGSYGVGLRDGDVLTAVEGRSVQAEGQVVGIVMVLLARHTRRISGEFWRGDRRGSIIVDVPVVELPQLNER